MDVEKVRTMVHACTKMFAKPGFENDFKVAVHAPVLNDTERQEQHRTLVDVYYCVIAVDMIEVEKHRDDFIDELRAYPEPDALAKGVSFLELGLVVGNQDTALRVLAVGQALHLWNVVTPEMLGFGGQQARALADEGMLYNTGFRG